MRARWIPLLLGLLATSAGAGDPEVFPVMPPGERVLQSGIAGVSAVLIAEGVQGGQGGRMQSDLRGNLRFDLEGVVLELRDGQARSVDPASGRRAALDETARRRLALHDFFAIALQTRPVFAETTPLDLEGRRWRGRNPGGESGILYRDERGRVSGYDVHGSGGADLEVRFLEWTRLGDLELPARVRTVDERGTHSYRFSGFREEPMPDPGPPRPVRWRDEEDLPLAAREALGAERAFGAMARTRGMKAAFLQWLVPGATVFAPGPVPVEERFAPVPDDPSAQPALEWLPEWIVLAGSHRLAAISGRWNLRAPDAELPDTFGQYLSIWEHRPEGWRVVADIGTSQEEELPLTPRATGRVVEMRAPRVMMVPDPEVLARQVEEEFAGKAFADGYLRALRERSDPDVIVLRPGTVAARGSDALTASATIADLAPRIEVTGSAAAASNDLLATWGVMRFDGDTPQRYAFLRVWQLETVQWQVVADVLLPMP